MAENIIDQVFAEMNYYFDRHDMDGAAACMEGWAKKFNEEDDLANELTVLNELIGFYRKMLNVKEGFRCIGRAKDVVYMLGADQDIAGATTFLNAATACRAFGQYDLSQKYFEKTYAIYEKQLEENDYRLASYYNNYALLMIDMKNYEEAEKYLDQALEILKTFSDSAGEVATTHMSKVYLYKKMDPGDSLENERSLKEINLVMDILENWKLEKDNYYALVSDSCGRSLKSLGRTEEGDKLIGFANEFYQSHRG